MKLSELASALGCDIRGGSESLEITGVAGMEQATASEVTFLANPKYAHKLKHTRAGAVLVAAPVEDSVRQLVDRLAAQRPTTERRVARLAADNLTNRQIAESLFVTEKTVETHLRSVYRKLNTTARWELAAKLHDEPTAS